MCDDVGVVYAQPLIQIRMVRTEMIVHSLLHN